MISLELLAPARTADIGIAAIDCGADAVYIAGEEFGARQNAGNSIEDIRRLCLYAHKYGARVFVTVNIVLSDDELPKAHFLMLKAQAAGADAFIIRDTRLCGFKDITVPLHASTQCAIRDAARAREYLDSGCSRIVLERELSLDQIRRITGETGAETECFIHGALCVCYSGECTLSEYLCGRSADRGECGQPCRSLYDLVDDRGNVLARNKALLSLKDFNLSERIRDLCEAGVSSFKIEGRLKNESYVRNTVRHYSRILDRIVSESGGRYRRSSFGRVVDSFEPDIDKTFNRGYTTLFIDGTRGCWSCADAPKGMGEYIGTIAAVRSSGNGFHTVKADLREGVILHNGDGFATVDGSGVIEGFRAEVCEGDTIVCRKAIPQKGAKLFRNLDTDFEKQIALKPSTRLIDVSLTCLCSPEGLTVSAGSCDGRKASVNLKASKGEAKNRDRMVSVIENQLSKRTGHYLFSVAGLSADEGVPFLSAAELNEARRRLAEMLDSSECIAIPLAASKEKPGVEGTNRPEDSRGGRGDILMRSRYCIRYELGLCPVHQGAKPAGKLFLVNNGKKIALHFDCKACEMSLTAI